MVRMWLLEDLMRFWGAESIENLCLIWEILKCLSIVFIACLGWVLASYVVYTVAIHLMPIMVFLVVAVKSTNFECSNVSKIRVEEGSFRANDCIHLS